MANQLTKHSVAVITGAGSGIGRALALQLANMGAALALADVNGAGLNETRQLAAAHNAKITTHEIDVSRAEQVEEFARAVEREHGRADYLFNNAGVGLLGTVAELSLADYEWLMGVNFWGVVHGVKFFLPLLQRQSRAHVVNVSSVFGLFAPAGQSAYAASKFAVRGFTEALRHEMAGTNIVVSCVHPGGIKTEIARNARVGANADANFKAVADAKFDRVARTAPERAAQIIIRGMLKGRPRILVGADAHALDRLIRLMPLKHWELVKSQMTA